MRPSQLLAAALAALVEAASVAVADLQAVAAAKALRYESGEVHMEIMMKKESFWAQEEALGMMNSSQYPSFDRAAAPIPCVDGLAKVIPGDAKNTFKCNNVSQSSTPKQAVQRSLETEPTDRLSCRNRWTSTTSSPTRTWEAPSARAPQAGAGLAPRAGSSWPSPRPTVPPLPRFLRRGS